MKNTFAFDEARRRRSKRAFGYDRDGGWVLDDDDLRNRIHGSGSIYSTVEDLELYDRAFFGGHLLQPASLQAMITPGHFNNGKRFPYGLGLDVDTDYDGEPYIGHNGIWMGFTSQLIHYPKVRLSVILLSNSSATDTEKLAFATAKAFRR